MPDRETDRHTDRQRDRQACTLADKVNRVLSIPTALVYSSEDDTNMILIMSLSYYAEHLLVVKLKYSRW